ncbi:leucine-rich repeat receptor-like serine/threonine/tyrosine-protein kinase SOBIR1 [Fagus crenata]
MAPSPSKPHLSLLTLLSLFLLTHSRLILNRSDLKALSIIQKDLGLNCQHYHSTKPCNTPGVICERRLSNNNSYELRVTRLIFTSQRLTGFLSPSIGRLSELKELSISDNQLVDQIPSQMVDCRKLEILNLQNNQFSGEIPSELSSLIRLRVLDVASNKFSGDLSFLKYFPNLENLSIADNFFTGKVPASIRSFRNLRFFNFSGNQFLEGSVPLINRGQYSASDVPKRYILAENTTRSSNHSRSNSSTSDAPAHAPAPAQSPHKHKNSKRKLAGWILGFLAGALAGSISGFIFSLIFKLLLAVVRGRVKDAGPAIFSPLIKKAEDLAFLEKDDGLASLELIGSGGCGQVYKCELPGSNGKMIAIKKIIQPPKDAAELTEEDSKLLNKKMRQIRSEINTVGQIRHRNLLPLLAHVSRPDCHYLVYEFMKNGVLVMGKLPSDQFFQDTKEMSLVKWMRNVMTSENPRQAIDQKLMGNGFEEQMLLVLKIACFCTLDDPKQRPNSKDVRCMLSQIKH